MRVRSFLAGLLLIAALSLTACGSTDGSPSRLITEARPVGNFNEVEIQGIGRVILSQGDAPRLLLSGDDSAVRSIEVDTANNRLRIRPKAGTQLTGKEKLDYQLTVKDLKMLDISGGVVVDAQEVNQPNLTVKLNGAGNVLLRGKGDALDLALSGAGSYQGDNYEVKTAKVMITGAGNADVNATTTLDVSISGAGSVNYLGNPQINQNVSGAGKIQKKAVGSR